MGLWYLKVTQLWFIYCWLLKMGLVSMQARLPWDTDGELGLEGTRSMCLLEQQDTNDRTLCSTPGIPSHTPSPTQPPAQSPFLPPFPDNTQPPTSYRLSLSLSLSFGVDEKRLLGLAATCCMVLILVWFSICVCVTDYCLLNEYTERDLVYWWFNYYSIITINLLANCIFCK